MNGESNRAKKNNNKKEQRNKKRKKGRVWEEEWGVKENEKPPSDSH